MLCASFGHASDDAVVLDQLAHHPAGQDPFGAMRDMHVERLPEIGVLPQPSQTHGKLLGRADRRGRFEDYGIARDKDGAIASAAWSMQSRLGVRFS